MLLWPPKAKISLIFWGQWSFPDLQFIDSLLLEMFPQNRIAVGPHHPLPQSGSLVSSLMTSKSLNWNKRGLIHVYKKKHNTRDNTNYKVKTKNNFWSRKTWTWVGKNTTSCYGISSRIIWNWEFLSEILRVKLSLNSWFKK